MVGDWPLVGRQDELAYALKVFTEGSLAGLVLAGHAGVGKSRLAAELSMALREQGLRVFSCAATKAAASIPFGAVAELVPDVDVSVDNRLGVFQAVVSHLGRAPGAPRVVIALDDAHLADEATAALVHHLATRRLADVVLTVRVGEPVPDAITALWKDGHCSRLEVQSLAREEVDNLAVAALDGPVDRQTCDRLWNLSRGNPLLVRELLLQALEDGTLATHRGFWRWTGEVHAGTRLVDVVRAGLGRLSADEREAVALVAYGEPIGAVPLAEMVGEATLRRLVDRGPLRIDVERRRRTVSIGHPLYGEVTRAETSASDASRVMRRLAEDVQRRGCRRAGDAGRVARWALEVGMAVDAEVLEQAAREAYRASDFNVAARLAAADPDWPVRPTGYILGGALEALERDQEANDVLERAAVAPPNDELRARIALTRADLLFHRLNRPADADAIFVEAMESIDDPRWRDLLAVGWAPALVVTGRQDEAMALLNPRVDGGDTRTRLAALRGLAYVLVPAGQTERTLRLCDELLGPAFELRGEWATGLYDVIATRVTALLMEGRLSEAEAILDVGDRATNAERDPATYSFINVGRGRLALFQGAPVTAAARLREAIAGFTRLDLGARGSWTFRLLAEALALVGDAAGAETALADARANDGPVPNPFANDGRRAAAWTAVALGQVGRAQRELLAEADAVRALGQFGYEAIILHDAARLGAAVDVAPRLGALVDLVDGALVEVYASHAAALAAVDGAGLDAASERFEELGFLLNAAEAATEAAAAHHAPGLTARSTASALRAGRLRDRCEGAVTPALAGAIETRVLTRREREVATLAAHGMSSKGIAETISVSRRTVDNHLQRAYEKLGVRRREQLAIVLGLENE